MGDNIRIGIMGWGNLGKGTKEAIEKTPDMQLVSVFTRRDPQQVGSNFPQVNFSPANKAEEYVDSIDVMILCGGSATDLPEQTPYYSKLFNTVDSYDTHAKIPEHFESVDKAAQENGKTAAISIGWDPGLFSLNRMIAEAILPEGNDYTFWGKGVSQGHSDAVRRVDGVKNGLQYTIPKEEVMERVRKGEDPSLSAKERHLRECYVVAEEGADKKQIEEEIKNMPHYFDEYETKVFFITEEELAQNHAGIPHGGFVIRSGKTGPEASTKQIMEFGLKLDSNPEFTASALVAYARAVHRLNKEGQTGAKTIFDIPPVYLSTRTPFNMRKELL